MQKFEYEDMDVSLYYEKMPNGLDVYVIPDHNVKSNYAFFSTKYGNRINEFIPINASEFKKYPAGIAHFLEHKVFEQKEGVEPFKFYSAHGAYCNAFTNQNMTSYYFEGMDHFKDNLEFLLDFVQSIYLTYENVEKEKGIIVEEAKMGMDELGRLMYNTINELVYVNDPRKYKVIGEIEEIKSITKEQLLECYNTFYHPSNMNLIVSGNVDYKEVFDIVKKNQSKKDYEKISFPKVKMVEEPSTMNKREIITKGNTKIPLVSYVIKVDLRCLDYDNFHKSTTLRALLYMLFSTSTGFSEKLRRDGIISGVVKYPIYYSNEFAIININTRTKKISQFLKEVDSRMKNTKLLEEDFERFKKLEISSYIKMSSDAHDMASWLRSDLYFEGNPSLDEFVRLKNFSFEKFMEIYRQMNFKETGRVIIKAKK